jgi:hypothetical protein
MTLMRDGRPTNMKVMEETFMVFTIDPEVVTEETIMVDVMAIIDCSR